MSYRLSFDETVVDGVIRIAREQTRAAIDVIDSSAIDPDEAVHDIRRHCKLVRAVMRIVRPVFPRYRAENIWYRDIGRSLALSRDATASIEAFDALIDRFDRIIQPDALTPIRERLEERHNELNNRRRLPFLLSAARRDLKMAYRRCGNWRLEADGFEAVAGGLKKTYRRARRRMGDSRHESTTANLHQWRKRSKYHRYHLKLLRGLWPPILTVLEKEAHKLTDYLGDDHDLATLQSTLLTEPERFGQPQVFRPLFGLIDWRRAELQKAAFPQGLRLFSMPPETRIEWFSDLWSARLSEQAPRPIRPGQPSPEPSLPRRSPGAG